jgi:hypothetical protein
MFSKFFLSISICFLAIASCAQDTTSKCLRNKEAAIKAMRIIKEVDSSIIELDTLSVTFDRMWVKGNAMNSKAIMDQCVSAAISVNKQIRDLKQLRTERLFLLYLLWIDSASCNDKYWSTLKIPE